MGNLGCAQPARRFAAATSSTNTHTLGGHDLHLDYTAHCTNLINEIGRREDVCSPYECNVVSGENSSLLRSDGDDQKLIQLDAESTTVIGVSGDLAIKSVYVIKTQ